MEQQANKIRVALLFGSCSSEHEVSCVSAAAWADALATMPDRYEVILVGITKQGRWLKYSGSTEGMRSGSWEQNASCVPCVLSPDRSDHGLLVHSANGYELLPVDVVAPILHGKTARTARFRACWSWLPSPMWAAAFWHPLPAWTKPLPIPSWTPIMYPTATGAAPSEPKRKPSAAPC